MKVPSAKIPEPQKSNVQPKQPAPSASGAATITDNRPSTLVQRKLQAGMNTSVAKPVLPRKNNTGLPDNLKSGIENLSGYSMDDVKVHYNSSKPAQLRAHAYAQGSNIHLAAGQEKHLPHEAWHVVQQKQGRVKPTRQLKSKVNINDDVGLEKEADAMGAKANRKMGNALNTQLKLRRHSALNTNTVQREESEEEKKRRLKNRAKRQGAKELVNPYQIDQEKSLQLNFNLPFFRLNLNARFLKLILTESSFSYTKKYNRNLRKKTKLVTAHSGVVPKDIATFSDFSVQNDTVVMLRHVNPRAGELLQLPDVIGKPMTMKGKSSNGEGGLITHDPTKGFIPENQNFSKMDRKDVPKINKYQNLVDEAVNKGEALAVQLVTDGPEGEGKRYWYYIENKSGGDQISSYDFFYKKSPSKNDHDFFYLKKEKDKDSQYGSECDSEYSKSIDIESCSCVEYDSENSDSDSCSCSECYSENTDMSETDMVKSMDGESSSLYKSVGPIPLQEEELKELKVMGDPRTGKRYTADYDLLVFAGNADREFLNMKILPDSKYETLNVAEPMQQKQKELLEEMLGLLPKNENLRTLIIWMVIALLIHEKFNQDGEDRSELVKTLTTAQRHVYMEMAKWMESVEPELQKRFKEMQSSIQETDLEVPDISNIRGFIYEDEEAAIAHLNRATDQATWHGAETHNPGGFKGELHADLKGGITIFTPDGDVNLIRHDDPEEAEKELLGKINELRNLGYAIFPNPRWGWRTNKKGQLYIPAKRIDMEKLNKNIKQSEGDLKKKLGEYYNILIQLLEMESAQHEAFKAHWNRNFPKGDKRFIEDDVNLGNRINKLHRIILSKLKGNRKKDWEDESELESEDEHEVENIDLFDLLSAFFSMDNL